MLDLDADWRFSKGDFANAMIPAFDDAAWQRVDLPHDWSSEGPFSAEYGSGNGYAPGGIGWYRKHFKVSESDTNKLIAVEFDGVYDHSRGLDQRTLRRRQTLRILELRVRADAPGADSGRKMCWPCAWTIPGLRIHAGTPARAFTAMCGCG